MRIMMSFFRVHGEFCASHPLEVVVATVTIISSLVSMRSTVQVDNDKVCGWNYECAKAQKLSRSDVIVLSVARCVALVHVYMQFRSLRRIGAKHLLGISGVFTIFSSFIFCIAIVRMFGNTISGLYEALPFFLFLIDLSKASALTVFALSSTSRADIQTNIGKGMELLGPAITLDAVVESLAIGVGTISGVQQLETMCSFGCLSVIANYVAFMTFYPACLALVLELSMNLNTRSSVQEYKHLAEELKYEHEVKKPNPVIQRVKVIMSVGLAVVHVHSRLVTNRPMPGTTDLSDTGDMEYREPEMSIWQFYLYRVFAVHIDYGLTLMLGVVLLVKYMFVDRHTDLLDIKHTIEHHRSMRSTAVSTQTDDTHYTEPEENLRTSFSVGDASDDKAQLDVENQHTQTPAIQNLSQLKRLTSLKEPRPIQRCIDLLKTENGVQELTNAEIKLLVERRCIPAYKLEGMLGDYERGVSIRRQIIADKIETEDAIDPLPFSNYDYTYVDGACCENVIGYMPVPVGVAGPLMLNGQHFMVPMATTEGCLVASTNRGCRALGQGDGVHSKVIGDGMTRGPAVRFPSAMRASFVKFWLEDMDNFDKVKGIFDSTSRFARLQRIQVVQAGRLLFIRFVASTGDAMGMNMLSKGTEKVLHMLQEEFSDLEIISLSGNICTDKKSSAINWIEGRGKSVVCEAIVPAEVVKNTLKTSVPALVDLNISKNLIGSAMAGSIGGFNAHAANIVTAMFIATGQDPAQTVSSCNCITLVEATGERNEDLYISCTMPSLEVGTVGGGTILPPQAACLKMLGVWGSSSGQPGENAQQLARIVCGTVLAGELSLLSALTAGHLVHSHLRHNRSSISVGSMVRRDSSQTTFNSSSNLAVQRTSPDTDTKSFHSSSNPSSQYSSKDSAPSSSKLESCTSSNHESACSSDHESTCSSNRELVRLSLSLSHPTSSIFQNLCDLQERSTSMNNDKQSCVAGSNEQMFSTCTKDNITSTKHNIKQRHRKDKNEIGTCIKHIL